MIKTVASLLLAAMLAAGPTTGAVKEKTPDADTWRSLGKWRITTYCAECNEPIGRESASGKRLKYGYVAMNNVPMGSEISVEGEIFTVADRCGVDDTVDIFIPDEGDGICRCDVLEYKEVKIK